jgi:predicted enzyme related to lactoylglutathione lyase
MTRIIKLAALGLLLGASVSQAQDPVLPPLSDPPTGKVLAGKFVWADLVTDEVDAARNFYTTLFNLEWREIRAAPETYGLFITDGVPVAGLAYHEAPADGAGYGRWIHYLSVDDVARAQTEVENRGGRTVLSRRSFSDRGEFAIVMGADQALVGLMRSSSGDPDDYRSIHGEWLWRELYSPDPAASADLYRAVCQCEVFPREDKENSYFIASQDYLRASINTLGQTKEASAGWLGYVQVADVAATLARAVELGATVIFAPTAEVFDGRLAVIRDPVGGYLGLVHWEYEDNGEAAP